MREKEREEIANGIAGMLLMTLLSLALIAPHIHTFPFETV
jgi:hypothetical protein